MLFLKKYLYLKKIGELIEFINKIITWFINVIFDKGIRIIEAAVELVFKLSIGKMPPGINTKAF